MTRTDPRGLRDVPFRDVPFLSRDVDIEVRSDGTRLIRHRAELRDRAPHLPWFLHRNAAEHPDRIWVAQRRGDDETWTTLTYAEGVRQVNAVTQALLDHNPTARPVMVLSGNSLEHAVLAIAAMQASMPHVPATAAYSLRSTDFTKLRAMVDLIDPGVIFVQSADQYAAALSALNEDAQRLVVSASGSWAGRHLSWQEALRTSPTTEVQQAIERITPDTVAKYMFTSGSTAEPKAVTITQRMIVTATASNAMNVDRERDRYQTVMIDWLPWSHVAGGMAVFNRILEERGTLFIDDGRPTPDDFAPTLRNLREISPSNFSSMPIGYAMLVDAMDADPELAKRFFADLRFVTYSGARLPDDTYERFQHHAVQHTGRRIPFTSGYGSTETSAAAAYVYWPAEQPGLVGLPQAGIELKLVPLEGERFEIRVRSDAVTPGYLGLPELSEESRDDEGFFCMGDAAAFLDPNDPSQGLVFAGRVAEEFKLQSGTFVRVTSLRVQAVDAGAPFVKDVVVAGADRAYVGLLVWPNLEVCRSQFGEAGDIRALPPLRDHLLAAFTQYNVAHPSSSQRVKRVLILRDPPSQADGEISEKGHVNQRRVLELRSEDVELLFAEPLHPDVIEIP